MRLLLLTALALAASRPSIDVYPAVVMHGGSVRFRCIVPRDPENRKLRAGFELHRNFEVELDGAGARVVYERIIAELPCEPGEAYCEVTQASGARLRVSTGVQVAGCSTPD